MKKFFALVIFSTLLYSCLPKNSEINSIEDLAGKRIGVQSGTTSASYISKHLPDSYLMEFITGYDAAEALKKRKIDAIVMDELPAKSIIARNDNLKIVKDKFVEEEYAVAVRKGNKELLDSINKTIREARENGTYKALVNAFISVEGNIQLPETKEAETDEYITMGTNAAFPPFEYTCRDDGKIIGFDISLGQIIADGCGKKTQDSRQAVRLADSRPSDWGCGLHSGGNVRHRGQATGSRLLGTVLQDDTGHHNKEIAGCKNRTKI